MYNKILCRPILSVIILLINKPDSYFSVVRFCQSLMITDRVGLHLLLLPLLYNDFRLIYT